jgi:hypothetical protein
MPLAHLEWIKDESPDVAPPCTFQLIHSLRGVDTYDDYKPFFLEGKD